MERYEIVKDIGSGNFCVAKLVRDRWTKELFAVKFIERGHKVLLTPTHLAIVMEYAAGGELFERICSAGRFSEDEARFFFQQLISGVSYCHSMQICHRDLKLENTLLNGSTAPRVKICDFGYSKEAMKMTEVPKVGEFSMRGSMGLDDLDADTDLDVDTSGDFVCPL
ncbi:hypothetical protein PVK06_009163 [Gossypium arboreum]|uniref:non-specific serine/threonine protein kinase n=1 Tax=Gossypium arboreum TaxID=29729 RepID=A0ABR0QMX6_GOSAR|nr:hypothetical protein PVK06_009163 [Gossypium arboreum]